MTLYSLPTKTLPSHCPCQPRSRLPFPTRIHRVFQSPPRTAHHVCTVQFMILAKESEKRQPKRQMSLSIMSEAEKEHRGHIKANQRKQQFCTFLRSPKTRTTTLPPQVKKGAKQSRSMSHPSKRHAVLLIWKPTHLARSALKTSSSRSLVQEKSRISLTVELIRRKPC